MYFAQNILNIWGLFYGLTQIEAVLNSRPIFPLSKHPSDLNPLTFGHFLIGKFVLLEYNLSKIVENLSQHHQRLQRLVLEEVVYKPDANMLVLEVHAESFRKCGYSSIPARRYSTTVPLVNRTNPTTTLQNRRNCARGYGKSSEHQFRTFGSEGVCATNTTCNQS